MTDHDPPPVEAFDDLGQTVAGWLRHIALEALNG